MAKSNDDCDNLLVIQPLPGIGDTVWHLPHIKALADSCEAKQVTLLTKERSLASQLLSETTFIKDVLYLSSNHNDHFGIFGSIRLGNYLAPFQFDQAWVLHGSARYGIAAWWAGIPTRVGFGIGWQDAFLTSPHSLSRQEKNLGTIAKATRLLQLNDIPFADQKPRLRLSKSNLESANKFIDDKNKYTIALAIGSSEREKQWGSENFITLLQRLRGRLDINAVLIGGKTDESIADTIIKYFENENWLKKAISLPILEAAAIAYLSDICIGNDTGILNIAAAVDTPAFGIFCGSVPQNFDPLLIPVLNANSQIRSKEKFSSIDPDLVIKSLDDAGFLK